MTHSIHWALLCWSSLKLYVCWSQTSVTRWLCRVCNLVLWDSKLIWCWLHMKSRSLSNFHVIPLVIDSRSIDSLLLFVVAGWSMDTKYSYKKEYCTLQVKKVVPLWNWVYLFKIWKSSCSLKIGVVHRRLRKNPPTKDYVSLKLIRILIIIYLYIFESLNKSLIIKGYI